MSVTFEVIESCRKEEIPRVLYLPSTTLSFSIVYLPLPYEWTFSLVYLDVGYLYNLFYSRFIILYRSGLLGMLHIVHRNGGITPFIHSKFTFFYYSEMGITSWIILVSRYHQIFIYYRLGMQLWHNVSSPYPLDLAPSSCFPVTISSAKIFTGLLFLWLSSLFYD